MQTIAVDAVAAAAGPRLAVECVCVCVCCGWGQERTAHVEWMPDLRGRTTYVVKG